ncbi:MAG: PQQ-binding-like beta-propeller repeat protein [Tepidisphaeraceae bacterium]
MFWWSGTNFCRSGLGLSKAGSLLLALLISSILWVGAAGQAIDPQARDLSLSSGVFVSDSTIALDQIALARRLESQKEWTKSAEVYQGIIDQFPDRVVPVRTDDPNLTAQYTSVLTLVNQHLRQWPEAGLAAYRARYEPAARQLVLSAHRNDLAPLHEAFNRYFPTDSAREAGLKLIDAYFEMGDYAAAIWIGRELLVHPDLAGQRPMLLFKLGLAAHLSGDDPAAQVALKELTDTFAGAIGTIRGRDVNLTGELRAALGKPAPVGEEPTGASAEDSWPTLGGDVSRGRVYSSSARAGARVYSIPLGQVDWSTVKSDRPDLSQQYAAWNHDQPGISVGVMPVTDRGELFFQDNAHVFALNLESGQPLAGWLATYRATDGRYTSPGGLAMLPGHQYCLTLTDNVVLGVMEMPDLLGAPGARSGGRVVCLDRGAGAELWAAVPTDFPQDILKTLTLGGAPLVAENNVYVVACGSRRGGYDDCYVICLDLASGKYRWSSYIASGLSNRPALESAAGRSSLSDQSASLAYAGGRVFVSTNLGAVASLDAQTGMVDWLDIYHDANEGADAYKPSGQAPGPPYPGSVPPPWTVNSPIIEGGNVFVLPSDGKYVLVYDAGDGHVVKRLKKDDCFRAWTTDTANPQSDPTTLLGVLNGATVNDHGTVRREDLLLLANATQVCALNWRGYDPAKARNTALVWVAGFASPDAIRGHAFVTADSIYLPGISALQRFDIKTGKAGLFAGDRYPAIVQWPEDEEPGNVLVCGDRVVVAGEKTVSVYGSFDAVQETLNREIAAAPADADVRLNYARTLLLAGQTQSAMEQLDAAIDLIRAAPPGQLGLAKTRAFHLALDFATEIWRPKAGGAVSYPSARAATEAMALAGNLLDRTASLAQTPFEQAASRAARASFARFNDRDPATAIKLYQEILADDAMRRAFVTVAPEDVALPKPKNGAQNPPSVVHPEEQQQAAVLAEEAIHSVVQDFKGQSAYAAYEQAAVAEYNEAGERKDPDGLAKVFRVYPNSSRAWSAAVSAIYDFEAKGMFSEAAQVLRQIYPNAQLASDEQRAVVDLTLAHDYLHIPGGLDAAEGRLAGARGINRAGALPFPLQLPDGPVIAKGATLNAAILAVDQSLARESLAKSDQLPEFDLPSVAVARNYLAQYHHAVEPLIPRAAMGVVEGVDRLLVPDAKNARYDRVVTWTAGAGISLYAIGSDQPVGTDAALDDEPAGVAWVGDKTNLLAWANDSLVLIDGDQVAKRWRLDLSQRPAPEILYSSQPPKFNLLQRGGTRPTGLVLNQPVFIRYSPGTSGKVTANGAISSSDAETITAVTVAGDLAVVSTSIGRVAAVDLSNGAIVWQIRPLGQAPDRVEATEDFTVIQAGDEFSVWMLVLETRTGRLLAPTAFFDDPTKLPVNWALGDDGTLAVTRTGTVAIVDLFDMSRAGQVDRLALKYQVENAQAQANAQPFMNMGRAGQVLVHGGSVFALSDQGRQLRAYDVHTRQEQIYKMLSGAAGRLPTPVDMGKSVLQFGGSSIYAWNPRQVRVFSVLSLADPSPVERWERLIPPECGDATQLLLGKDYLAVLSCQTGPQSGKPQEASQAAVKWWISAFMRATSDNPAVPEMGTLACQSLLADSHGIVSWQMIDGGLCYLAGDHTLHFLAGNQNPAAPADGAN